MDKIFGKEKAQAINAKCGGIKPLIKGVPLSWPPKTCIRFQQWLSATNASSLPLQGVVAILMSSLPNRKPELILYDTVTNNLPDGVIINEKLIHEGFAKKDKKWALYGGLLPWQHPDEQLRQRKKKSAEEATNKTEVKSSQNFEKAEVDKEIPHSKIQQSMEKVSYWFDNLRVGEDECIADSETTSTEATSVSVEILDDITEL